MNDTHKDFFEDTHSLLSNYVNDRLLLFKIQAASKSGKIIASLFTLIVIALFSFFILFFVSMMGGYFFAELTHSTFYGFSIIAGIYVFLLLIFLINKKSISNKIINSVITILFEKSSNDLDLEEDEN